MHIDSHEALGVVNTLFEILAPASLRPVDMLLRSMFVTPDTMVSSKRSIGPYDLAHICPSICNGASPLAYRAR